MADFHIPRLTFSVDLQTNPDLKPYEIAVGGKRFDLSKAGQQVRVSGPRDRLTCERCIPWIGRTFDRNDPSIQMFREGGVHPRCRHYLTPVGVPGLDREVSTPGLPYVRKLQKDNDTTKLRRLYGVQRTDWMIEYNLDPKDLYRPDGTLWTLEELVSQGVVPDTALRG